MTYAIPDQTFNAHEAARNRIIFAGQYKKQRVDNYKSGYEKFWQTPRTHGDSALSTEDMQSVIDQAPAVFAEILSDSAQEVAGIASIYPEALTIQGDADEPLLPERYLSSPYNYEIGPAGITLLSLKPEWEAIDEGSE